MKRVSIFKRHVNVTYWLGLMIIAVILSLGIYRFHNTLTNNWFAVFNTLIGIAGMFITMKDISQRFQQQLYKFKVILLNKQVAWSLDGRYKSEDISKEKFEGVKLFLKELGDNNTVFNENKNMIILSIDGITLQCSYEEEPNNDIFSNSEILGNILIYVTEYHAPYVEATVLLEERIFPILNEIGSNLKNCSETFTFDLHFKEHHPFLGLYLKKVKPDTNFTFNCTFIEPPMTKGIKEDNVVSITKNKITFNTRNLYSLNRVIQKHLFLSGG